LATNVIVAFGITLMVASDSRSRLAEFKAILTTTTGQTKDSPSNT
jgi:hypothetical protein